MEEHAGDVQRDRAANVGKFAAAEGREQFASGDGLRTLEGAHARLSLQGSGSVLVQSGTTIRLWRGQRAGLRLNVQTGAASVLAAERPLELQTELGIAVLQTGSELRVRPSKRGHRYEVTLGKATLTTADGKKRSVVEGESIGPDAGVPQPKAAPEPEPAPAPPPVLQVVPTPSAADAVDLDLVAGNSATVYDPTPPSRIQLSAPPQCVHGSLLYVHGEQVALAPGASHIARLAAGAHDYRLECTRRNGAPAQATYRGVLRVVHNSGTAQLPRSSPVNSIDADGRTYTVLFQNLLPVLEVRWPDAPPRTAACTLLLSLESGRELKLSLPTPQHVFEPGTLPEGRHQLRFEVGSVKSRPTTLDLRFDNASPTASLRSPPADGFAPSSHVHVAGIAMPGAQVSVLGQRLPLDGQQRFQGDVPLPKGTDAFAVRIHHPRTGTRYYVRRMRPSP